SSNANPRARRAKYHEGRSLPLFDLNFIEPDAIAIGKVRLTQYGKTRISVVRFQFGKFRKAIARRNSRVSIARPGYKGVVFLRNGARRTTPATLVHQLRARDENPENASSVVGCSSQARRNYGPQAHSGERSQNR